MMYAAPGSSISLRAKTPSTSPRCGLLEAGGVDYEVDPTLVRVGLLHPHDLLLRL